MMNTLLKLYFKLPHDRSFGIFSKIFNRVAAKILKCIFDWTVPNYFLKSQEEYVSGLNHEPRDKKVVVSFTSFPGRIQDVWIVVECLFRQTYKADKIVLWLDRERFKIEDMPVSLKAQIKRGLEIRLVEDLRAHTKYFYALKEFKNDYVVTVDDDCYYPDNLIENLILINKKYPSSIASNRIHGIVKNKNNKILSYKLWKHNFKPLKANNNQNFLTGVGGVLYPPNIFDEIIFKKDAFMNICKYADDVWLTMNAIKKKIEIETNDRFNKDFISISKTSRVRLLNYNSKNGGNDKQIQDVVEYLELKI